MSVHRRCTEKTTRKNHLFRERERERERGIERESERERELSGTKRKMGTFSMAMSCLCSETKIGQTPKKNSEQHNTKMMTFSTASMTRSMTLVSAPASVITWVCVREREGEKEKEREREKERRERKQREREREREREGEREGEGVCACMCVCVCV
jgi:hypothetical protein